MNGQKTEDTPAIFSAAVKLTNIPILWICLKLKRVEFKRPVRQRLFFLEVSLPASS